MESKIRIEYCPILGCCYWEFPPLFISKSTNNFRNTPSKRKKSFFKAVPYNKKNFKPKYKKDELQ